MSTTAQITAVWLKQVTDAENRLAATIGRFFRSQANRLVPQLLDAGMTPAAVAELFRVEDENELFLAAIRPDQLSNLSGGAANVVDAVAGGGRVLLGLDDLPPNVQQAVRLQLSQVEAAPYWPNIQRNTESRIISVLENGLQESQSHAQIARNIRQQMGGQFGRRRALRIARTETAGAWNAGHDAAISELGATGDVLGKQWLVVGDSDVRADHVALDRSQVAPADMFNVGGTLAPYPGHHALPASQRIHCRCTIVSVF